MKRFYTIREYCAAFGCGRTKVYSDIGSGVLEAVKDGTKTLITAESAERRAASLRPFKSAAASARATQSA